MERLHKFLARAGVASRRQAEELIRKGQVEVNGVTVREMGLKIEPGQDRVSVEGRVVPVPEDLVYILLNKPVRVVTTLHDPQNRTTVLDVVRGLDRRVYPVGRLDYLTEGLLLLTNDGELAYRLMHPRYKVDKSYLARVRGNIANEDLEKLRRGIVLEDGLTMPAKVKRIETDPKSSLLEITIREGRNRQVRRMCLAVGHPVITLKRTGLGPLRLGTLQPGQYRHLTLREVENLKKLCGLGEPHRHKKE